jgi:hypothetical protein
MKTLTCTLTLALLLAVGTAQGETIYADGFNRADTTPNDLGSASPGGTWSITPSGAREVSISSNQAFFDYQSASAGDVSGGWTYASLALPGSFTLTGQPGTVTWGVSMQNTGRNNTLNPNNGSSMGLVLGGTNSDFTAGDGYAVMYYADSDNASAHVRLIKYTGGLDVGDDGSVSVLQETSATYSTGTATTSKVTYDPADDTWSLYTAEGFSDPLVLGAGELVGSAVDATYTSSILTHSGMAHVAGAGNSTQANRDALLDNVSMDVIPEPTTMALLGLGGLVALKRRRTA